MNFHSPIRAMDKAVCTSASTNYQITCCCLPIVQPFPRLSCLDSYTATFQHQLSHHGVILLPIRASPSVMFPRSLRVPWKKSSREMHRRSIHPNPIAHASSDLLLVSKISMQVRHHVLFWLCIVIPRHVHGFPPCIIRS